MEKFPKIVRARLQPPVPATEPHPDADLLTAFAECTLAGRERDHVLEHLARCGDCREVVALAIPATEALALPHSGSAKSGWLSLPVLRWGVVAAGVVVLTSVGIVQYRERHQNKTLVATSVASRDQLADSAARSSEPAPQGTTSQPAPQAQIGKQTETAKRPPSPGPPPSRAQGGLILNKPTAAPHAFFSRPEPMRRSTSVGASHGYVGGSGFSSNAGRSSSAVTVAPRNDAEPAAVDQGQMVGKAKAVPDQASPSLAPAPLLHAEPILMKGPAAPRWTISANGTLQRSLDGGTTWLDVDIVVNDSTNANLMHPASTTVEVSGAAVEVQTLASSETEFEAKSEPKSEAKTAAKSTSKSSAPALAKSAPRPSAPASAQPLQVGSVPAPRIIFRAVSVSSNAAEVWAGGSGGALYHTLDGGNRWARVVPSEGGIVPSGDVIRIQFSNPRNGIVTTSTTEVWTTMDAGQTWHKQQ